MKSSQIFQSFLLAALLAALVGHTNLAFAEQLLFQRGSTLYTAELDGTEARPLFDLAPSVDAATGATVWSAAPDGRRVVWMRRGDLISGADPDAVNLRDRPAQFSLSDLTGRHQKPLFTTATLRDRQSKRVTSVGSISSARPKRYRSASSSRGNRSRLPGARTAARFTSPVTACCRRSR
jgi:hypothetical protein